MRDRLHIEDGEADTALVAELEGTRRDLVRRGIAAGGLAIAAGSVPALLGARNAFAQSETGDAGILVAAIGLEQRAVLAYETILRTGGLDAATTRTVRTFLGHEREHAAALSSALKGMGGKPPAAPVHAGDVSGLSGLRGRRRILTFAIELETMAIAAYYDAHAKLTDARLLQTGTAIMANEGQHLAMLRRALGRPPVPNAFETGKASS